MQLPEEVKIVLAQIKEKKFIYLGMTAELLSVAMVTAIPYLYGRLVDIAIAPHSQIKTIAQIILLWLILSIFSDFLGRYGRRKAYEIAIDVSNNLVVDLFHHLVNLPLKFHKEKKIGKVMRRIDKGVDDVFNLIERTIFSFLPDMLSFLAALIILLFVEWRLSLILIIASALYISITLFHTKGIIRKQKIMQRGWEKAYGDLWDSVLNAQTIKATTSEDFERRRNVRNFNSASRIYKNWRWLWQKMSSWQGLIFSISFVAVLSSGIMMLRAGSLTPGKLIMFVGYISLLTSPLAQLAEQYRAAKSAIASFKRAMKYYYIVPEKDSAKTTDLKEIEGKIVFENVGFGYKKGRQTLKDISFEIKPGQTVAIVGESGVGKTTLVDLVGRYYLYQSGRILIDDIDVKRIKLNFLRSQIALVPQDIVLFNDTVKNNIRYGRKNATEQEIIKAAKAANANEFIEAFPRKYNQLVGERGIKLSAGQKQRVAIARAILRHPKILILDEATSALDSVSEKLVQEALSNLIKGKTTFIIAHRLSTIQRADKIIVLEKGRIVETGKHEELMKNPEGIYRNFWELQTAIGKVT